MKIDRPLNNSENEQFLSDLQTIIGLLKLDLQRASAEECINQIDMFAINFKRNIAQYSLEHRKTLAHWLGYLFAKVISRELSWEIVMLSGETTDGKPANTFAIVSPDRALCFCPISVFFRWIQDDSDWVKRARVYYGMMKDGGITSTVWSYTQII